MRPRDSFGRAVNGPRLVTLILCIPFWLPLFKQAIFLQDEEEEEDDGAVVDPTTQSFWEWAAVVEVTNISVIALFGLLYTLKGLNEHGDHVIPLCRFSLKKKSLLTHIASHLDYSLELKASEYV